MDRIAALAAGSMLACALSWGQVPNPAKFLPVSAGVVRVEAIRTQGGLSLGSGVTVAPGVIATNCHVLRDAVSIRIVGAGTTWSVDREYADTRRDLCFLRAPSWRGAPAQLAASDAAGIGSQVVALGYAGGASISPRFGNIRDLHEFDGGRIIETDAPFNSGASGGGLFDADGALIGLLTFRLRHSVQSYYALPVLWIRDSLPTEAQWSGVGPLQGAAPFWQALNGKLPFLQNAALPAQLSKPNDFPTHARVDFVLACMREHPAIGQEAIYKCSCAIDMIAGQVNYESWVELSTVASATTIAGERGGVMRDLKDGRKLIARFREIQDGAKKSCFLDK